MPFLDKRKVLIILGVVALAAIMGFKLASGKIVIGFRHPESAFPYGNYIFVSNIGSSPVSPNRDGFITKLDKYGNILEYKFLDGLEAPKGLWAEGGKLYISDLNRVCVADIDTKALKCIPIKGSRFLNDIVYHSGAIYVTDTLTDRVYRVKGNAVSVFFEKSGLSPNGIIYSKKLGAFIVVSFNEPVINVISPSGTLIKSAYIKGYTGFDGVSIYNDRVYLSDYRTGRVISVSMQFGDVRLVKKFPTPAADIFVKNGVLLAPLLEENKLYIGKLSR